MQTKIDYIRGTTLQLDLWGDQFATLDEKLSRSAPAARIRLQRRLDTLRRRKRQLKKRLREALVGQSWAEWERARGPLEAEVSHFRSQAFQVYESFKGA